MAQPAPTDRNLRRLLPAGAAVDGTRRRLLEGALVLFAERGYHGVSVRDITEPLGIRPSALYAHVRSKADLLAELIRLGLDELRRRVRDAMLESTNDPEDQLRSFVRAYVALHAELPLLAQVSHSELHALPPELLREAVAMRKETIDLVHSLITRGVDSGVFTCGKPWLAVTAIAGMGLRVASWYRPPGTTNESPLDAFPTQVSEWFTCPIDELLDVYAEFALKLVR